jgi:signal peptidase I
MAIRTSRSKARKAGRSSTKPPKSGMKSAVELVLTVGVAVGLAFLIQAFVVKPYRIPSGSMLPTLHIGQRILANRVISKPSLGDIVVFHPPAGADPQPAVCGSSSQGSGTPRACDTPTPQRSNQTFIKRVVGVPGDRISIVNGHVIRNGVQEKDSYIAQCGNVDGCNFPKTITVPPVDYFMMGDNRGDSDDSRFWGPVPNKWIIGVAFFTYWPLDRIGFL